MILHDLTSPAAIHSILSRLLDDHQRAMAHDMNQCPLCQEAQLTIDLVADELPDTVLHGTQLHPHH